MLNSIADYFISLDVYSNYATLKALLNPDCQDVALDTPDHLRSALKRWLISSVDASSDTLSLHDFLNRTKRGHEYTIYSSGATREKERPSLDSSGQLCRSSPDRSSGV